MVLDLGVSLKKFGKIGVYTLAGLIFLGNTTYRTITAHIDYNRNFEGFSFVEFSDVSKSQNHAKYVDEVFTQTNLNSETLDSLINTDSSSASRTNDYFSLNKPQNNGKISLSEDLEKELKEWFYENFEVWRKQSVKKELVSTIIEKFERSFEFENKTGKKFQKEAFERVLDFEPQIDNILERYDNVEKSAILALIDNETKGKIIIPEKKDSRKYIVNRNCLDTLGLLQIMEDGAFGFFYSAMFQKHEIDKKGETIINDSGKPSVCYHNKKINEMYSSQLGFIADYFENQGKLKKERSIEVNGKIIVTDEVLINPEKYNLDFNTAQKLSWDNFKEFLDDLYVEEKDYSYLPDVEIGILYFDSLKRYDSFKNLAHFAAAFNAGPTIVDKELREKKKIINYAETQKYVRDFAKSHNFFNAYFQLQKESLNLRNGLSMNDDQTTTKFFY